MAESLAKTTQDTQQLYNTTMSNSSSIQLGYAPRVADTSSSFSNDIDKLMGATEKAAKTYYMLSDDATDMVAMDHLVQYEEQKNAILSNPDLDYDGKKAALGQTISTIVESGNKHFENDDRARERYDRQFLDKTRVDYSRTISNIDVEQENFLLKKQETFIKESISKNPNIPRELVLSNSKTLIAKGIMSEQEIDNMLVDGKLKAISAMYEAKPESVISRDGKINYANLESTIGDYVAVDKATGQLTFKSDNAELNNSITMFAGKLKDVNSRRIEQEQNEYDSKWEDSIKSRLMNTTSLSELNTLRNEIKSTKGISGAKQFQMFNIVDNMVDSGLNKAKSIKKEQFNDYKEQVIDSVNLTKEKIKLDESGNNINYVISEDTKQIVDNLKSHINVVYSDRPEKAELEILKLDSEYNKNATIAKEVSGIGVYDNITFGKSTEAVSIINKQKDNNIMNLMSMGDSYLPNVSNIIATKTDGFPKELSLKYQQDMISGDKNKVISAVNSIQKLSQNKVTRAKIMDSQIGKISTYVELISKDGSLTESDIQVINNIANGTTSTENVEHTARALVAKTKLSSSPAQYTDMYNQAKVFLASGANEETTTKFLEVYSEKNHYTSDDYDIVVRNVPTWVSKEIPDKIIDKLKTSTPTLKTDNISFEGNEDGESVNIYTGIGTQKALIAKVDKNIYAALLDLDNEAVSDAVKKQEEKKKRIENNRLIK